MKKQLFYLMLIAAFFVSSPVSAMGRRSSTNRVRRVRPVESKNLEEMKKFIVAEFEDTFEKITFETHLTKPRVRYIYKELRKRFSLDLFSRAQVGAYLCEVKRCCTYSSKSPFLGDPTRFSWAIMHDLTISKKALEESAARLRVLIEFATKE